MVRRSGSGKVIWIAACSAMLALTGCSDQINYTPSIEISTHPIQFEREGLDAAVVEFLGQELPDNEGGGGGRGPRTIREGSSAAIVRLRGDYPISKRIAVIGDVALSQGRGSYRLPDGIQILTDPTSVRFSSVAVVSSLGLAYQVSFPSGISTEVSAGVAHRTARTNTKIRSAILDTNSTSTISNQHAFVGAKLAYDASSITKLPTTVFVQSRVKRFKDGKYDLGVSLGVSLN